MGYIEEDETSLVPVVDPQICCLRTLIESAMESSAMDPEEELPLPSFTELFGEGELPSLACPISG